jgi:hypothetical protein
MLNIFVRISKTKLKMHGIFLVVCLVIAQKQYCIAVLYRVHQIETGGCLEQLLS